MFCPKCAAPNPDQAKFCRACGANLETVVLALVGELVPPGEAGKKKDKKPKTREQWLEKQSKSVRETVHGTILLTVASLIGFIMAVSLRGEMPGLFIWAVFFGWMAMWGTVSLASGIGGLIEAKLMLRGMDRVTGGSTTASTTPLLPDAGEWRMASGTSAAPEPVHPPSITEHTTEPLGEHRALHPDMALPEKQKQ